MDKRLRLFRSLKGKLMLVLLGAALIPLTLVGVLTYLQVQNSLEDDAIDKLVAVRNIKTDQIEDYFNAQLADVRLLSANPATLSNCP